MEDVAFYGRVDDLKSKVSITLAIKEELRDILDYLHVYHFGDNVKIGLKAGLTFKAFNQYFPDISKKQLLRLFDYCESNSYESKLAIKELNKEVELNE